jgi:type IV pilus assembly protein PilC
MLLRMADFYDQEVDTAVDALMSMIEPLIMAILGVAAGGLVIAMYLPMFSMGSLIGG